MRKPLYYLGWAVVCAGVATALYSLPAWTGASANATIGLAAGVFTVAIAAVLPD